MVSTLENDKGAKIQLEEDSLCRREPRNFPILSPCPCSVEKATAPIQHWSSTRCELSLSLEDQKSARYCPYHGKKRHTLEQYVTFRMIFDEKRKAVEILFWAGGTISINELTFLSTRTQGDAMSRWPPIRRWRLKKM